MSSAARTGLGEQGMLAPRPTPLVHLELHTGDLVRARSFYAELCGWRPERLSPREGPAGWRSVVATPAGGEIALWQPKR
jgi:predicted enzyme related to lactoylglutathione lyase